MLSDSQLNDALPGAMLATATAGICGVIAFAALKGIEPAPLVVAFAVLPISLLVMRRWPMVLIAALMVVGNFKTTPAVGISLADPTMILFLATAGALALELLYDSNGSYGWTVSRALAGQAVPVILFLLFTLVLVMSLSYSSAPQYGATKVMRFASFEVLSFFAPLLLLKDRRSLAHLINTSIVLTLALVARDISYLLHPSARVLEGNADITQIGDGMLFAVAVLILLYHRVARSRAVTYAALAILSFGLVASAARSPILALVLALLICAGLLGADSAVISRKNLLFGILVMGIVAIPALVWMNDLPAAQRKMQWKGHELLALAEGSPISGGTILERINFDRSAIEATEQHPLLGVGVGGWSAFYLKQDLPRFPHNFVLEVAAEQGLVGLTLLGALLVILFRSARRLAGTDLAFVLPVLTFLVLYNMFTGDVENRYLWFWFGMVLAAERMVRDSSAQAPGTAASSFCFAQ